jgi:hypothetical protein
MTKLSAATVFAALVAADAAHANLMVTASDDGVPVVLTFAPQTPGNLVAIGSDGNFSSIRITAHGFPAMPQSDLETIIDAQHTGSGTDTLSVDIVQTAISSPAGLPGTTVMTVNGLIGAPGQSTLEQVINGTVLHSNTFPATATSLTVTFTDASLPAITEDVQIYQISFSGSQAALDTIRFASAMPEPATLEVFGMALIVLALLDRKANNPERDNMSSPPT